MLPYLYSTVLNLAVGRLHRNSPKQSQILKSERCLFPWCFVESCKRERVLPVEETEDAYNNSEEAGTGPKPRIPQVALQTPWRSVNIYNLFGAVTEQMLYFTSLTLIKWLRPDRNTAESCHMVSDKTITSTFGDLQAWMSRGDPRMCTLNITLKVTAVVSELIKWRSF